LVDYDLITGVAWRVVASRHGAERSAVWRHATNCIPDLIQKSKELREMLGAQTLLERLSDLDRQTLEMLAESREAGNTRTALMAVRESRGNVEAFSKITQDPLKARIRDLEQQIAARDALMAAANLVLNAQGQLVPPQPTLPPPSPDEIRVILRTLIEGGVAIDPRDQDHDRDRDHDANDARESESGGEEATP
jgi:hypothetical protein